MEKKNINRLEIPVRQVIVEVGIQNIQRYLSWGEWDKETETFQSIVIGNN